MTYIVHSLAGCLHVFTPRTFNAEPSSQTLVSKKNRSDDLNDSFTLRVLHRLNKNLLWVTNHLIALKI